MYARDVVPSGATAAHKGDTMTVRKPYSVGELRSRPTHARGEHGELKLDCVETRVWVSETGSVTIERLEDGSYVIADVQA